MVVLPNTIFGKSFFNQNHLFPRKKVGFSAQNHLFFPRENQKTIFLESGRIVSQKMFFVVLVFSLGKVGF